MKLATTMGIELSYCVTAIQTMFDRGVEFNHEQHHTPGESVLCEGLSTVLRALLDRKKVNYHKCATDPSCVEVSTKPYIRLETLINISERVGREARAIGLSPRVPYTVGGGAHIHTGVVGNTEQERKEYIRRMMVFGAQNPWLSWAFGDIYDDKNREPLHRNKLIGGETMSVPASRAAVRDWVDEITEKEKVLHSVSVWEHENSRWRYERRIEAARIELASARQRLRRALMPLATVSLQLIRVSTDKGRMFRMTWYGKHGTIEMRMFDMGDSEQLARQIKLADAIVRYVSQQTYTKVEATQIPTAAQLSRMPWRVRRDGFINMLRTLGLDPADYRVERVRIAERMRYRRTLEQATPEQQADEDQDSGADVREAWDAGAIMDRARARHQRRHRA